LRKFSWLRFLSIAAVLAVIVIQRPEMSHTESAWRWVANLASKQVLCVAYFSLAFSYVHKELLQAQGGLRDQSDKAEGLKKELSQAQTALVERDKAEKQLKEELQQEKVRQRISPEEERVNTTQSSNGSLTIKAPRKVGKEDWHEIDVSFRLSEKIYLRLVQFALIWREKEHLKKGERVIENSELHLEAQEDQELIRTDLYQLRKATTFITFVGTDLGKDRFEHIEPDCVRISPAIGNWHFSGKSENLAALAEWVKEKLKQDVGPAPVD
jgi:hypothetical protein